MVFALQYSRVLIEFLEIRPGDEIVKIRTLKVKEMNSSLSAVEGMKVFI